MAYSIQLTEIKTPTGLLISIEVVSNLFPEKQIDKPLKSIKDNHITRAYRLTPCSSTHGDSDVYSVATPLNTSRILPWLVRTDYGDISSSVAQNTVFAINLHDQFGC